MDNSGDIPTRAGTWRAHGWGVDGNVAKFNWSGTVLLTKLSMFQLTVEEYVEIMEMLVNDYRFTMYNMCYKRVLMCWITLAFCVLLGLLFSGVTGILLFSLGVGWLFLNAVAIFVCMWAKMGLARGLEKCLARVNKQLMKHKILIALDDRGNISCHKIHLCFIYFDSVQCVKWVNQTCQFKQMH